MKKWRNQHVSSKETEDFFRKAARAEGLTYHQWCDKYGILDNAGDWQIRQHEISAGDMDEVLSEPH